MTGGILLADKTFTVGGLQVTRHCNQEEMNEFVEKLPAAQKQDVKDVLKALLSAGMISIKQN
mgnify:CR=1 FL=1|jgi:hypothetical protein